jgi:hypothetical protein
MANPIQKSNTFYMLAFTLLSIADLYLTETLLATGLVIEANPIAAMFIDWLPHYKAVCVTIVLVCLTCASFTRPRLANRVLMVATAAMVIVVMYSLALLNTIS